MKALLLSLFFGLAVQALSLENRAVCPSASVVQPCTCTLTGTEADITCENLPSLRSLTDIFARTFPNNDLTSIVISRSDLASLPNNVFNGKSFQRISFLDNRLTTFSNPTIFSASSARLESLTINQDTGSWVFNAANINGFNALTKLELTGYNLMLSGSPASPSLTNLTLRSDLFVSLPTLGALPALSNLNFDGSTSETIPASYFNSLNSLNQLYLGHNKLKQFTISFSGPVTLVDLSSNLIETVLPGWVQGVSSATNVLLLNNYIALLDRALYEPVIQALLPSGRLYLDGNPLTCGCEVGWVITNANYLQVASDARCANGTRFTNLNPNYFQNNC